MIRAWDDPAPPLRLTPLGERVRDATASALRTAAWALVAFFIGLALATAYVQGQHRQCAALTAAGSPTAPQHCPPTSPQEPRP